MSNNLLELLKEHLSEDVISNIATLIGESPKNTETALNTALPSLLAGLVEKSTDNASVADLFNLLTGGSYDGGVLSNLGALSRGGDETAKLMADGGNVLESFFGNKSAGLADLVANTSGISKDSSSKLLSFVTPIVLGLLGKNLKIESIENTAGLAGLLNGQSGFLKNVIPAGLGSLLSVDTLETAINKIGTGSTQNTIADTAKNVLSNFDEATDIANLEKVPETTTTIGASISDTLDKIDDTVKIAAEESLSSVKEIADSIGDTVGQAGSHVAAGSKEFAQSAAHAFEEGAGESRKLLPWILIAAALTLIWGLLRSCGSTTETETVAEKPAPPAAATTAPTPAQPVVTAPPAQPAAPGPATAPVQTEQTNEKAGDFYEKALSTGYTIKAAKDGFISKLVGFIESNQTINKDLWFSMDGVTFDTNKATIKKESDAQINDIAEILKAYPKVKIKIGGYTDNTGNAKANKKLSANRADAVKKALTVKGVKADRLDAEGYGNDHPVASNDTEEGRQQNRRIDVRVIEK